MSHTHRLNDRDREREGERETASLSSGTLKAAKEEAEARVA